MSIITLQEKVYISFNKRKKKKGTEEIQIERNPILKKNKKIKNYVTISKKYSQIFRLKNKIKIPQHIKISLPERRTGTTLLAFLNKSDDIVNLLEKYIKLICNLKVDEFIQKIQKILSKYNVNNYVDEVCSSLYFENDSQEILEKCQNIINILENKKLKKNNKLRKEIFEGLFGEPISDVEKKIDDEELLQIVYFAKEFFSLCDKDYSNEERFTTLRILLDNNNILYIHRFILKNRIKNLSDEFKETIKMNILNKEDTIKKDKIEELGKAENVLTHNLDFSYQLSLLVEQIFKTFFDIDEKLSTSIYINEFIKYIETNLENKEYNTYYKELYFYLKSNKKENYITYLYEISKIFIESLEIDIKNMIINYEKDVELKFVNHQIENEKIKFEITSLNELFYYSKYYIQQDGRKLKSCKYCSRFFLTENKTNELYCKNVYVDENGKEDSKKRTCSEIACFDSTEGNKIDKRVNKELKTIREMLRKRDKGQLDKFNDEWNIEKNKFEKIYTGNQKYKFELEWLEKKHSLLKTKHK